MLEYFLNCMRNRINELCPYWAYIHYWMSPQVDSKEKLSNEDISILETWLLSLQASVISNHFFTSVQGQV